MCNEELLRKLIADFGESNAIIYCKMESAKNAYLFDECVKNDDVEKNQCFAYDYERDWWKDAENKLIQNIK